MDEVTRVLSAIEQGNSHAAEQLLPLVYGELRRLAAAKLAHEKPGQTLQATALVHEAYLRLVDTPTAPSWNGRGHFFAAAAEAMRRILVDQARRKLADRHGGRRQRRDLAEDEATDDSLNVNFIDLDEALTRLAAVDEQLAEVVKLRVFAGITIEQIAEIQGVSPRSVKRTWAYARAWLGRALADYNEDNS